ncbi:hypothetical protein RsoM2USA_121 [Ralstonia phage RsoM2USA]|nr:hypothetical protein RsoM2USA_121 [Ralstonia phage RsoM2USA]
MLMSMVRTPGDIIRAVNEISDVTQLIETYLLLWRKHCNGINDITIPSEKFLIQITGFSLTENNTEQVIFNLIHLKDLSYSYDVDEPCYDLGSGPWDGVDGVLGYSRRSVYQTDYKWKFKKLALPFTCILDENIEDTLIKKAEADRKEKERLEKERQISKLEKELAKLKNEN